MRDTEKRVEAVQQRMGALRRVRHNRRMAWLTGATAAVCICLLIAVSMMMPARNAGTGQGGASGAAASIFAHHASLGYAVIGILGFLLGVALTLFGIVLRRHEQGCGDD